ncbi:tetratricopeptide repeat protein [Parvularcula sp. LCG005]|uniref:tetratricopeptide repeat protein n=1 Tax=Parvularcula sp. LCG005 TaxID=3078805 RepID=UPI00294392FD|nr:tetratricopeptide repeat protein [Parvularcula sp. LCG005]WOI54723.1 hypothetical protein RUI03_06890 [Parvularcula sp. LCG005]
MTRSMLPVPMALLTMLSALSVGYSVPVMAQEDEQAVETPLYDPSEDYDEDEDVMVVRATRGRMDQGMSAFKRGDYVTAEIEFKKNLRCVERVERLEDFAVEQAQSNAVTAESQPSAPQTEPRVVPSGTASGFQAQKDGKDVAERTCERADWQVYMIAMSQLKLGRLEEAKENFYRVIRMSKDPLLFDAHYRIGLLEVLDDNFDEADDRLKQLKAFQRRCRKQGKYCETTEELKVAVDTLELAIREGRAAS